MTQLLAIFILILCFAGMAAGLLLARKVLKKGCSLGPDCLCKDKPQPSVDDCEHHSKD